MSELNPGNYPLRSAALRPSWSNRRSQALAAAAVSAGLAALLWRAPLALADLDDIVLRIGLPVALGFVLAFAPLPGTPVGRIARDLTVAGLCASVFAGDRVPVMLACYPLLLVAAVVIGSARQASSRRSMP